MLERIIHLSIRHRWLVLAAILGFAALGIWSFQRLPIDAVPDITNVQVQINSEAQGFSPRRGGAAHHLPDRDRIGRATGPRIHPFHFPLRPVPGHRDLQGRDRHLLRPAARERASPERAERIAIGDRSDARAHRHRPRRDLHVHDRARAGRRAGRTAQHGARRTCARSRTGSSGPSSGTSRALPR